VDFRDLSDYSVCSDFQLCLVVVILDESTRFSLASKNKSDNGFIIPEEMEVNV
jgi:hypothetical protein